MRGVSPAPLSRVNAMMKPSRNCHPDFAPYDSLAMPPRRRLHRAALAAALAASPALASAQARPPAAAPAAPPAQAPRRPQLFHFRGALGPAYGALSTTVRGGDVRLSGFGVLGNFAMGLQVARGLAVHLDASALALVDPAVTVGSMEGSARGGDATSTTSVLGGGVTYRHAATHVWASLSGGISVLSVEIPSAMGASYGLTDLGWGLTLLAGHDWTFLRSWHFGVAIQALVSVVPDRPVMGEVPTWVIAGGGVAFTIADQ